MIINVSAVRDQLVKIITPAVPDTVPVYRSVYDGPGQLPCVVIGMPSWSESSATNYCLPLTTIPVWIVVAQPGTSDEVTVDELDQLWPGVLEALRDTSAIDPGLGGICKQSVVGRTDFGLFTARSQQYPAQAINLDLYG